MTSLRVSKLEINGIVSFEHTPEQEQWDVAQISRYLSQHFFPPRQGHTDSLEDIECAVQFFVENNDGSLIDTIVYVGERCADLSDECEHSVILASNGEFVVRHISGDLIYSLLKNKNNPTFDFIRTHFESVFSEAVALSEAQDLRSMIFSNDD